MEFAFWVQRQLTNTTKKKSHTYRIRGFSLVELILIIAIISLLAALLLPVFYTVRGRARQSVCISNLRQTGLGISMYAQDYDGLYPYAVDPVDRFAPAAWSSFPEFAAAIPQIDLIHQVLQPYTNSLNIFACPADSGFAIHDFNGLPMDALPTSYEKYGTSYYYRTEIAARRASESMFTFPSQVNVLFDGAGHWHGTLLPLDRRYNVLFADGHVKNISYPQIDKAWKTPF